MNGRGSRNKGARGERELCALLSQAFDMEVKRKLGAARDGGDDVEVGCFSFESKKREVLWVDRWMAQAIENAEPKGQIPVVAYRKKRQEWRVVMRLDDILPLMKAALKMKQKSP